MKVKLALLSPEAGTAEVLRLYKAITGKEPTAEEVAEVRGILDEKEPLK